MLKHICKDVKASKICQCKKKKISRSESQGVLVHYNHICVFVGYLMRQSFAQFMKLNGSCVDLHIIRYMCSFVI